MIDSKGQFHQTFSPSEKLPTHGVCQKNCCSISLIFKWAAKFARDVSWNLPNLCAIHRMPFAKKGVESFARKKKLRANVDEIDPWFTHLFSVFPITDEPFNRIEKWEDVNAVAVSTTVLEVSAVDKLKFIVFSTTTTTTTTKATTTALTSSVARGGAMGHLHPSSPNW